MSTGIDYAHVAEQIATTYFPDEPLDLAQARTAVREWYAHEPSLECEQWLTSDDLEAIALALSSGDTTPVLSQRPERRTPYRGYSGWITKDTVLVCYRDDQRLGWVTRHPGPFGAFKAYREGKEGNAEFYHLDEARDWVEAKGMDNAQR